MSEATIQDITTQAVLAPLARPITTANARIEAAPLILVDVLTSDGITGRAYLFAYSPHVLRPLAAMIDEIRVIVTGQPAVPADRFDQITQTFHLLGRQGIVAMAMAGLDMALWDALGQRLSQPVVRLLGAAPRPLACYDSLGLYVPGRDDDQIAGSVATGFKAIKVKIGGATLSDDIETLTALRDVAGPDVALMIDYNQSLTTPEALRRLCAIEDRFDIAWIEEPIASEDLSGYATLRARLRTPLQSGENWWLPEGAAAGLDGAQPDHAMPDLMKIGGVTGWIRAMGMAHAKSCPVSSHLYIEGSAHVLAATPGAYLIEYLDVAGGLLQTPLRAKDGQVTAQGPGLGMVWDEDALRHHAL